MKNKLASYNYASTM